MSKTGTTTRKLLAGLVDWQEVPLWTPVGILASKHSPVILHTIVYPILTCCHCYQFLEVKGKVTIFVLLFALLCFKYSSISHTAS